MRKHVCWQLKNLKTRGESEQGDGSVRYVPALAMTPRHPLIPLVAVLFVANAAFAEPSCVFENAAQRLISPTNAADWRCMNQLAKEGDAYWQYYVGLQLINGFEPAGGDHTAWLDKRKGNPPGIQLLHAAARSKHVVASANAMNQLSIVHRSHVYGRKDLELSYQWAVLASQQELFKAGYVFAPEYDEQIAPARQKELQMRAAELLRLQ